MRFLSNERGFTLIEVVASIVIISMALLLLSNFIVRSYVESGVQDNQLISQTLARQVVEDWKSGQYYKNEDYESIIGHSEIDHSETHLLDENNASSYLDFASFMKDNALKVPITFQLQPLAVNGRTYTRTIIIEKLQGNYSEKTTASTGNVQFFNSPNDEFLVRVRVSSPNSRVPVTLDSYYTCDCENNS
ncbi:type IV pilus modification PilV family protein [Aneurinibacillus tyrosinisolvens]|uniref:type IV pilus modification PilV family protein n=1 Tax=Aneurinibacillus tyrosinisolvens TaxID=1443435 RepID=UPI00069C0EE5|nr:prepilin-type N-terminal cleavage/methylation domain-containing protein [Aneurinibacillus tyrosinisolvens]